MVQRNITNVQVGNISLKLVIYTKKGDTMMKRFALIIVLIFSMIIITGCENFDLEYERNQLEKEIKTLQNDIDNLQNDISTLQKTREELIQNNEVIYIIELEISQSHFTLDLEQHLKDEMNTTKLPIQVSEEYYYSVEEGDLLSDEFRIGSFIFKGSIGSWKIKVANKEIVYVTE